MKGVLASDDQSLNDCVHGNNQYLNLYFNKQTQSIEPSVPDDKMALMLDVANTIALWSALQMQELHTQDAHLLSPFTEKLKEYLAYSRRSSATPSAYKTFYYFFSLSLLVLFR